MRQKNELNGGSDESAKKIIAGVCKNGILLSPRYYDGKHNFREIATTEKKLLSATVAAEAMHSLTNISTYSSTNQFFRTTIVKSS